MLSPLNGLTPCVLPCSSRVLKHNHHPPCGHSPLNLPMYMVIVRHEKSMFSASTSQKSICFSASVLQTRWTVVFCIKAALHHRNEVSDCNLSPGSHESVLPALSSHSESAAAAASVLIRQRSHTNTKAHTNVPGAAQMTMTVSSPLSAPPILAGTPSTHILCFGPSFKQFLEGGSGLHHN